MSTNEHTAIAPTTADDPYVGGIAISYAGGDQTLSTTSRGILVGGAGNLAVTMLDGTEVTLTGLLAGHVYRVCVKVVKQTGSTATNCVALL